MDNFEYEYNENEKSKSGIGKTILIIFVVVLIALAFFAGILSRDYISIFDKDKNSELETESPTDNNLTPTPEISTTDEVNPTQTPEASSSITSSYADMPTLIEEVSKGVVSITTYYASNSDNIQDWEPMAYGTGVIMSSDGYIVTNNHVIEGAGLISATLLNGEKIAASVIGSDKYVDLAVLKIEKEGLYTIPFGDSSLCRAGEQVIAIGSPLGDELTGTVTAGIISAVDRQLDVNGIPFTLLQTDAPINPGNSGGPLVNMNGEVIGINTLKSIFAGYDESGTMISAEGIGYAIPSNSVTESISEILEYGGIVRPFIGVYGSDVNNTSAYAQTDQDLPDGFLVAETVENSPAALGGILPDDVIIGIDGEAITGFTDLYTIINSHEIGDTLTFKVYRPSAKAEIDLEITLASNQEFDK